MHAGNRDPHQERARQLGRREGMRDRAAMEDRDNRRPRYGHGKPNRAQHQEAIVVNRAREPHGRHAEVVHRGDAEAHRGATGNRPRRAQPVAADQDQRQGRREDGRNDRQRNCGNVIQDRHRQGEREHPDVVHGPHSEA